MWNCSFSLQVSMSSVMAALAPGPTLVLLSTARVCHLLRRASFPWALLTVILALHHQLMYPVGALLMRARPSPTLRGSQGSFWAAAWSEQVFQAQIRPGRDLCQQVIASLNLLFNTASAVVMRPVHHQLFLLSNTACIFLPNNISSMSGFEIWWVFLCTSGDLDRMMAQGLGYGKSADAKKPSMCANLKTSIVDPKFQCNLEPHCGTEMYRYPSPLHAVALQSPLFSHVGEAATPGLVDGQVALINSYDMAQMGYETKTLCYIDKLLQRSLSKIQTGTENTWSRGSYHSKPNETVNVLSEAPHKDMSLPQHPSAKTRKNIPVDSNQTRHCLTYSIQEPAGKTNHKQSLSVPDVHYRYSYPAAMKESSSDEVSYPSLKKIDKPQAENFSVTRSPLDKKCVNNPEPRPHERKGHRQRPVITQSSSTEESQSFDVHSSHTGSPEFVHARFVPAGSQKVKIRQADRKTKALRLKRKGTEKPRALRQQHGYSSGERIKEISAGTKANQKRSGKGKVAQRVTTCHTKELRQASGSDSSLYNPGLTTAHKVTTKPHLIPAVAKFSKNHRLQSPEYEHPGEQRKRRYATAKWPSDVDMFQVSCAQRQRSKEPHARAQGNVQMVHNMSAKPGQWMRPPFQSSMSSDSFLHNLNARYPPAPFHMSSHYPPKCESEYSAECASLFHSTIAESSEGEISDNTTNCFGDSESSQSFQSCSDSDSSLSLDEGDQVDIHEEEGSLVWADAALGPTAAGRPLKQLPSHPEPSAFRIKASRALKKKIRRFQPASLKVMTLV